MRCFFIFISFFFTPALAQSTLGAEQLCRSATIEAEQNTPIPSGLLGAIAKIESGRHDLHKNQTIAWPWTVNAAGKGYFFATENEAIEAVKAFRQQGIVSLDVGCMQINLHQHADAFSSLEQAFDPLRNAQYAAHFLTHLYTRQHEWFLATSAYHSLTAPLGHDYAEHVFAVWHGQKDAYHPPDFLPQVLITPDGPKVIFPQTQAEETRMNLALNHTGDRSLQMPIPELRNKTFIQNTNHALAPLNIAFSNNRYHRLNTTGRDLNSYRLMSVRSNY